MKTKSVKDFGKQLQVLAERRAAADAVRNLVDKHPVLSVADAAITQG